MPDLDSARSSGSRKPLNANYTAFAALRPTPPTSGRSTPLNGALSNPTSKPATPANDSFSTLVSFSSTSSKNLTLQEQQRRLQDHKLSAVNSSLTARDKVWTGDEQFWNDLGSGRSTPLNKDVRLEAASQRDTGHDRFGGHGENDIFDAFNSSTPRAGDSSSGNANAKQGKSASARPMKDEPSTDYNEDDDPFGLTQLQNMGAKTYSGETDHNKEDTDLLGLLGRPAESQSRPARKPQLEPPLQKHAHPQDEALVELVDMGFPPEKAQRALESTESGMDVQAAVSWLLTQAHAEARQKTTATRRHSSGIYTAEHSPGAPQGSFPGTAVQKDTGPGHKPPGSSASAQHDKDPAKLAQELGTTFLKTAGSLWKQGSKKVQQAYQEFNSDSDSNQPKWMRENSVPRREPRIRDTADDKVSDSHSQHITAQKSTNVTDEALMLEMNRAPPAPPSRQKPEPRFDKTTETSREHSPVVPSRVREANPATLSHLSDTRAAIPASKPVLNRQAIEDQASQAYVSSARRRRPVAPVLPVTVSEPDLLEASNGLLPSRPVSVATSRTTKQEVPQPVRAQAPPRNISPISAISLRALHEQRELGNAQFKKGDYASAHQSYSKARSYLPSLHPIAIVLLTNHALTALKIGEPKIAIASADQAITIIGPSKGDGENIDLQAGDAAKPMRDYYGKALARKAEALEQLERWNDAAAVWTEAVEGGHGGTTSIQGRLRAEKAANPQKARPQPARRKPRTPALSQATSAAAVRRLRAANAAADKADDEKFALSDAVDTRLNAWRGGKADNLRALLASLDTVLWSESGWKKISMVDLVLPSKVKVQYMKGIAKVHPDKIPTDATTEQRMIAGAVFSTLNEAWDKFKSQNGL